MKLVIQRVSSASVLVKGKAVGQIDNGLFVLFGAGEKDTKKVVETLADKLVKLRIMSDDAKKMNLSVKDADASILVVSQFTLYADTSKGNRPSFVKAAPPDVAQELYDCFIENLQKHDIKVQTGRFGEFMEIKANLDGPVTILIEE